MEAWTAIPIGFIVALIGIWTSIRVRDRDRAADAERLAERVAAPARDVAEKLAILRADVAARFALADVAAVRLEVKLDRVVDAVAELRKNLDVAADAGHGDMEAMRGHIKELDVRLRSVENWRHRRDGPSGSHETADLGSQPPRTGPRDRRRG